MLSDGVERKIFGSGISFLLIVLYLEVRDLNKKTEQLESRLNRYIERYEKKNACFAENDDPAGQEQTPANKSSKAELPIHDNQKKAQVDVLPIEELMLWIGDGLD